MNTKKAVIAGVLAAVVSFIFSWLTCGWLFNWVYALPPIEVWKPITSTNMAFSALTTLFFGIVLALVYALLYKGLPIKGLKKGLLYGFIVWLVGTLPGMASTYSFTVIAPGVVIYWTLIGLVHYLLLGLVIAAIYKKG